MVDDLEETRDFLKRALEPQGFRVLRAVTVDDALRVLAGAAVDAIVADLWLGRRGTADGGHLLDTVGRWHRGVARVIATADPLGGTLARDGGYAWYDKDLGVGELVALLRKLVPRA